MNRNVVEIRVTTHWLRGHGSRAEQRLKVHFARKVSMQNCKPSLPRVLVLVVEEFLTLSPHEKAKSMSWGPMAGA